MPVQAKLEWPLGNERKPSCSLSVLVHTRQSVRPCVGFATTSAGSWQRSKKSGRGRPTVILQLGELAVGAYLDNVRERHAKAEREDQAEDSVVRVPERAVQRTRVRF